MRLSFLTSLPLLPLAFLVIVSACPLDRRLKRSALGGGFEKRVDNARLTWYDITVNEVACGGRYSSNDYVVALDAQQFDNGGSCGKEIAITVNGKTVNAQVVDDCPDCPYGALDLTQSLFGEWASTDAGVLYGSWNFI